MATDKERETFIDCLKHDTSTVLRIEAARKALMALREDLNERICGEPNLTKRIVQAALLNAHTLAEGLPGSGKTTAMEEFSRCCGLRHMRVQSQPDLLPSDLIGARRLAFNNANQARLPFVPGPIFNTCLLVDEINRAPPKVQSALLQAMQERVVSPIGVDEKLLTLHPVDGNELDAILRANPHATCYDVEVARLGTQQDVPFLVVATQNPVESEGTYPLPEAQLDRFLFKLELQPLALQHYDKIQEINLRKQKSNGPKNCGKDDVKNDGAGEGAEFPLWVRAATLLIGARDWLLHDPEGPLMQFVKPRPEDDRPDLKIGLRDRVWLVLRLTHALCRQPYAERSQPIFQEDELRAEDLAKSIDRIAVSHSKLKENIKRILQSDDFAVFEYGASNRAIVHWPRAAAAEAFLKCGQFPIKICRAHFRNTAGDVLGHRCGLTIGARAEGHTARRLIDTLVNDLLPDTPNEETEDRESLFRT